MPSLKFITKEIPVLESLHTIAQVYQETSIAKIQEVRSGVLVTRDYLDGLTTVYSELKSSPSNKVAELKKIQKTLFVLLSANTKLYGEIVQEVYKLFIAAVKADPSADIMIVGRLGERMFAEDEPGRKHLFFEVPDASIQTTDLEPVIFHIVKYQKVTVFHGKFYNLVTQRAARANISGESLASASQTEGTKEGKKFLFEPSLEQLLQFFEKQIFATLFRQTVHESELARYASRVNAMEESLQFIKKRQKILKESKKRLSRAIQQKRQLERLSGMSLWR